MLKNHENVETILAYNRSVNYIIYEKWVIDVVNVVKIEH